MTSLIAITALFFMFSVISQMKSQAEHRTVWI